MDEEMKGRGKEREGGREGGRGKLISRTPKGRSNKGKKVGKE